MAFDLTFSAPKSVSVLFAVAPEHVSGRLIAYHEEAVSAALGYLEDTAVMVRRGHGGESVEPAGSDRGGLPAPHEPRARPASASSTACERPDERRPREVWENGVRQAARYRAQYDITDTGDALGPRPESREQQRDWERAREALERSARRLGRAPEPNREINLGIEF